MQHQKTVFNDSVSSGISSHYSVLELVGECRGKACAEV